MREMVQAIIKTIDSREIADMLGAENYKIIEKLDGREVVNGYVCLIIKCNWKTCKNCKDEICRAETIELRSFDYEEDNEELEGLKCSNYQYDSFWMCEKGREVDTFIN